MQVAQLIVEGREPNPKNSFGLSPGTSRHDRDKVRSSFNRGDITYLGAGCGRRFSFWLLSVFSLIRLKKRLNKVFFRSGQYHRCGRIVFFIDLGDVSAGRTAGEVGTGKVRLSVRKTCQRTAPGKKERRRNCRDD